MDNFKGIVITCIPDSSIESGVCFNQFRNIHENHFFVVILHTDQTTDEILFQHLENLYVIALGFNLNLKKKGSVSN